jgi:hypothetical protein
MVHERTHRGLIVTHAARGTSLVDHLAVLCDWPVLRAPTVRTLFHEIDARSPVCLLFWLDSETDITPAAQLVVRLQDRGPRPYRIAVAHRLEAGVEHTFRAAGVHSYFAAADNLSALVEEAILPLAANNRGLTAATPATRAPHSATRASPATLHPP